MLDYFESTSLGDLLRACDFGAFLKVGSALERTGASVKDSTIGSRLLDCAASSLNTEINSLDYGNSPLEWDNSALGYLNSLLDFESTSVRALLLDYDSGASP